MLCVRTPDDLHAERDYALGVVLGDWLGQAYRVERGPGPGVVIRLDEHGAASGKELALDDAFFARARAAWLEPASVPQAIAGHVRSATLPFANPATEHELPVLFGAALSDGSYTRVTTEGLQLGVDVFGSVFFLLSRYEELATPVRDTRDRATAAGTLAGRAGLLDRPLADEYAELLWSALRSLWPQLTRPARAYRLLVSHDVDRPFFTRGGLRDTLRRAAWDVQRRDPRMAALRLVSHRFSANHVSPIDPHDTFDFLMRESEARGLRSAFYFMTRRSARVEDADYDLTHPWIRRLITKIGQRGHELGLHPSYDSYLDAALLAREARDLMDTAPSLGVRQEAWGGRQHYLRFRVPETWQAWQDAGLAYDSSSSFSEQVGFRSGTCREHAVFNLKTRQALSLRERPLVFMEASLHDQLESDPGLVLAEAARLSTRCRRMAGSFTLLWHNSNLHTPALKRLYREVLDACR
jgi:hypothetical protein